MKKIFILASIIFAGVLISCSSKKEKLLLAGSGAKCVAIMDKDSKTIEWTYDIPEGGECNSAVLTKDGNVLFSYAKGACLVDTLKNVIWDFKREEDNQEIQSARETEDGYLLAACGFPAKFIFLDKSGNKVSETSFNTHIDGGSHGQFRQVRLAKNGNILVPLMGSGYVYEIAKDGTIVNQFHAGDGLFSIEELQDGNLLLSGAFGVASFDRTSGKLIKQVITDTLPGIKFGFPTQTLVYPNGHMILSNWQGHEKNQDQAILVELDSDGNEVWIFDDNSVLKFISSIYTFEK